MAVSAQGLVSTKRARIVGLNPTIIPASVSNNSAKEELCLEYVDNFRRQFVELFSRRRPLLLTAKNEAGVEKFVSTTIRPSLLSHKEVRACA